MAAGSFPKSETGAKICEVRWKRDDVMYRRNIEDGRKTGSVSVSNFHGTSSRLVGPLAAA